MQECLKEADRYIQYLEDSLSSQDNEVCLLEARILKMIHANRQRQKTLTLEEVDIIMEAGGDGC